MLNIMITQTKKYAVYFIFLALAILGILDLGRGDENRGVLGKDVHSFLLYEIDKANYTAISNKSVSASEVTLTFTVATKHIIKRALIFIGLAIQRKSVAEKFEIQSQETNSTLSCLVRTHGDEVIAIAVQAQPNDEEAIRFRTLLHAAFPDYDIQIMEQI